MRDPDLPFLDVPARYAGDFASHASLLHGYDGRPVAGPGQWPARRAEIIARWQALIGTWPPLLDSPACTETARRVEDGLTRIELSFEAEPGRSCRAILLLPQHPRASRAPAVLVPFYDPDTPAATPGRVVTPTREHATHAYGLCRRGYVTLAIGYTGLGERPLHAEPLLTPGAVPLQPLHRLGWTAEHARRVLAARAEVDPARIGITGFSFGGKWAMFAAAFNERFACTVINDAGVVFNEADPNCNYWEPWYLGAEPAGRRRPGVVAADNPRTGAYRELVEQGRDLTEILALLAPRPFLVSGGEQDPECNWRALNRVDEVYALLGARRRLGLTTRPGHAPTPASNEQMYDFFDRFL